MLGKIFSIEIGDKPNPTDTTDVDDTSMSSSDEDQEDEEEAELDNQIQEEQSKELQILTQALEKMRNKFNNALSQREENQSSFIDNHLAYHDVMGGLKNNMSQAKNIEKYMKELEA